MSVSVRSARPADARAIAAIWNQGIEERQATFDTDPRSEEDVLEVLGTAPRPFLAAVDGDRVLGWARLSAFGSRPCYAGVGEASIYVDREARGAGAGRALLAALEEAAAASGHWKVIGLLFPTNGPSVNLFRTAGYREVGTYRRHGRLDGEWRDVLLVERSL